jgi:hypothetical protein
VLACFGLCGLLTPAAHAQAPPGPETDVIVTTGEGVVRVAPDRVFVTISAESRAASPRDAQRQNTEAKGAVQQRLKAFGLSGDAVRTLGYDLQPEFNYVSGRQVLKGYVARNTMEVRVDELERAGEVMEAAVGSGATSIRDIRFDVKARAAVEREALKQAVVDARARAEAVAAGAGRAFDRILRGEERGAEVEPLPRPMMGMRAEAAAAAPAPPVPVEPGELEIRARVTLVSRMK